MQQGLTGRVLDPEGKPVAGGEGLSRLSHPLQSGTGPGFDRVRATTSDDGRFQFRATGPSLGQPEGNKEWCNATITAVADAYGPARKDRIVR